MSTNLFSIPMVFFRVGWMNHYRGLTGNDGISNGGSYVAEHGFGHEIFNFEPIQNAVFGYVQPPGWSGRNDDPASIKIDRLGAKTNDDRIDNVLTVWVAKAPEGGSFIVGWYNDSTVFRNWQPPPRIPIANTTAWIVAIM